MVTWQELDRILRRVTRVAHAAQLSYFLKTEAEPPIYYLPAVHNAATRQRLREQQQAVCLCS